MTFSLFFSIFNLWTQKMPIIEEALKMKRECGSFSFIEKMAQSEIYRALFYMENK